MTRPGFDTIVEKYRQNGSGTYAVVNYYSRRARDPRKGAAKLTDLRQELRKTGTNLSTDELNEVFTDFQNAGWGELKRGKPRTNDRFQWSKSAREMAKGIADIAGGDLQPAAKAAGEHEHSFVLRSDYTVGFKLPGDFSAREAKRLTEFIGSLPFERDE